ncbi:hypothetical protein [Fibrobacter sp. UBA4297]|uniref:hypothetical protein n=1 Tax=Fibrobacter sp. UBA4297 TaxID=1946536 RepID=UPI0025B82104|nr:hypothetical protein [Fibrobacter sp. UBA4297]
MFKKILLLTAAIVTSSFATWDYFGLLQNNQGSVKAGLYYDTDDDWSQMGLKVGARMNVTPQFELSLQGFGYQFWGETDCDACSEGGSGLRDLVIGARYALDPELYFFLDFNLPIGKDKAKGVGTTAPSSNEMFIYAGAQHHSDISAIKGAAYGTEAGLFWGFEHNKLERGLELRLGGEFDFTLPSAPVTLLVGGQFWLRLFKSEFDNGQKDVDLHDDWSNQFKFWVGANFAINQQISLNGQIIARSQDLKKKAKDNNVQIGMEGDALGFTVDMEFKF